MLEGNWHDWLSVESQTRVKCVMTLLVLGSTRIDGCARRFGSAPWGLGYEHRSQGWASI